MCPQPERMHNHTDHELSENFELAGEAGLADSSHVVGLLPHHLLHLHDGGGARQCCGNEGQLEGSCSGKPVMLFTQQQLSVIIFQPLLMQRFVYSPRTLKPSGTPLYSSLTKKPSSNRCLFRRVHHRFLVASKHFPDFVLNPQKLNALWVNCEEQARWLTSVVCQVTVNHYMTTD